MRWLPKFHQQNIRLVLFILGLSGAIWLGGLVVAFFGPPFVPLWYSLTVSEEQLAPRLWTLAIPGLSGAIALVSLWFGRHTALEHESYVATISLWSGAGLLSFLLLAFLRIIWVVL